MASSTSFEGGGFWHFIRDLSGEAVLKLAPKKRMQSDKPYSQVEGRWSKEIDKNTYDVTVIRVDDASLARKRQLLTLEPGSHKFRVLSSKAAPTDRDKKSDADFSLSAKPCIKYYISDRHENPLSIKMTINIDRKVNIEHLKCIVKSNKELKNDTK